jgi:predicted permease
MDVLMWATGAAAYFAIGLRLHFSGAWPLRKFIAALAAMRFGVGAVSGLALAGLSGLSPWPMSPLSRNVFVVESFVPTAITAVAVANMFGLRPREASMLFLSNTGLYLVAVLPLVVAIFG